MTTENPDHDERNETALTVPATLSDMARLRQRGREMLETKAELLHTARGFGLKETHPTDWVLFKAPDEHGGQVVGYLSDAGCDRVRDIFGIEVYDVTPPVRIAGAVPGEFMYVQSASGRSKFTGQVVEHIEGGRSSTDDFCKDVEGPALELLVRKACRANTDGNITRELAGLKAVPLEELARAWDGSPKKVEQCRLGRGFGSRSERLGGTSERVPDVTPPVCPHHNIPLVYRPAKGNRGAFYGCSKYQEHPKTAKPVIVDAATWVVQQQAAAQQQPKPAPATNGKPEKPEAPKPEPSGPCAVCGKAPAEHATADHEWERK
jgi:hypothetical protein